MDLKLRPIVEEEYREWTRAGGRAFGGIPDEQSWELHRPTVELERTIGVFDDGLIVAGTYTSPLQISRLTFREGGWSVRVWTT